VGSTLGVFYRRPPVGQTTKQIFLRTSTDGGLTWSGATQLTNETDSVYQIQASDLNGTVYVFWSLADTSGLVQYVTSTDLVNWSAKASVGQAIGPLDGITYPYFSINRFASGTWGLAWIAPSPIGVNEGYPGVDDSTNYPVVWFANSPDLVTWSNQVYITLPYSTRWPRGLSLAQDSTGTIDLAYTHFVYPWDNYVYLQTSTDDGVVWQTNDPTQPGTVIETMVGDDPNRPPNGYADVSAANPLLVVNQTGTARVFWDQSANTIDSYTNSYDTQIFRRDLPSGAITPLPAAQDPQSGCGCHQTGAYQGDPVDVTTGAFTLPETDFAIPGRGPGLTFRRTYNASRLVDGPLGYGWEENDDTHLTVYPSGEVLIVDASGRVDLYTPSNGSYTPPPGQFTTLTKNGDGTWTLRFPNQSQETFSTTGQLSRLADRNGNALTLAYNGSGQLTAISDAAGRQLTLAYSGAHISSVTDPLERRVQYGYSPAGDLTSVVDARNQTWTYTYDSAHELISKTDPNTSVVFTNVYGTLGHVVSQTDALQKQTQFAYSSGQTVATDPLGRVTTYYVDTNLRTTEITDANSDSIYYAYDSHNNLIQLTDARDAPTTTNWTYFTDDANGNVLTRKNDLGNVWTYTYDSLNDLLTAKDPLGHQTTYTYDNVGNLLTKTDANNDLTTYTPDSYGEVVAITDARGKKTAFGYDTYGNQTTITDPYNKIWTTGYDLAGRRTSVTDPLSHTTAYGYDNNDNLLSVTDARNSVTRYTYDNANNRLTAADPDNHTTTYGYDAKNRLVTVTDAANGTTTNAYDAVDNLLSVTNADSEKTSWTYDNLNRELTETLPLGQQTVYQYDGVGNRTKRTDANGNVTTYAYDAINRPTTISYPVGSVSYGYDAANRRTSMTDSTGATTYGYDAGDRLTSVTFPGNQVVSYGYDGADNRTSITYPDGKLVQYAYDDANRLSTVTDWQSKVTSYGYDDAGNLLTTKYPTGVVETRAYNPADQLTSLVDQGPAGTLSFVYALDAAGLRQSVQRPDGTESYTYDNLNRITGVTYTDGTVQSYTYDAVGNRLTKVENSTQTTYAYDANDRLTSAGSTSYGYDANGNQTTAGANTYTWDDENRLSGASNSSGSVSYTYRGDGLRASKTVGGVTTNYTWDLNAANPVVLQDGTDSYVYGYQLISQTDNSGNQTYFLGDDLGSTKVLTDASGNVTAQAFYDVFGNVRSHTGTASSEYLFAGQEYDSTLGYLYLRARYYDPTLGRFISKDPLVKGASGSQGYNRYAYVANDPTNAVDSSGRYGSIEGGDAGGGEGLVDDLPWAEPGQPSGGSPGGAEGATPSAPTDTCAVSETVGNQTIAERIANGHAWDEHADEWGMKSVEEFATQIQQAMDQGVTRELRNGRIAFYDKTTQTVVIFDSSSPDLGTAYRAVRAIFNSLK